MSFVFDTGKIGLETAMKDYQVISMRYLWEIGEEGANSRQIWGHVREKLMEKGSSISRASIIFFMNGMVDRGALTFKSRSGKCGYHRVYSPVHDEKGFKEYLAQEVIGKLLREFPEEASKALKKLEALRGTGITAVTSV